MKLPQIRQDRANHFIYGFIIFIMCNIFFNAYTSLGIVATFAIGKEIYDEYKYGGFDIIDLIFTVIPAITLTLKELINK
jgi:hypothetical protein